MLIAEDLLLLATDPDGRLRGGGGALDYALAGALFCDLELSGRVRHTTAADAGHAARRVVVEDASPTGFPILDEALTALGRRDRRATSAIRAVKRGLRRRLLAGLVAKGALGEGTGRVLGLIPVPRHPVADRAAQEAARTAVNRLFIDGGGDRRTEALAACLTAARRIRAVVPEVHPMLTRAVISTRSKELLKGHWAAKAARDAYQSDASAASGAGSG